MRNPFIEIALLVGAVSASHDELSTEHYLRDITSQSQHQDNQMYYQRPLPRYSSSPYEQPRHNRRYFSPMSLLEEPTEEPPLNETPILPISEENEAPAVQENETQQAEPANETPPENAQNV